MRESVDRQQSDLKQHIAYLAGKRVQNQIDTLAIRHPLDALNKGEISAREDVVDWYPKSIQK